MPIIIFHTNGLSGGDFGSGEDQGSEVALALPVVAGGLGDDLADVALEVAALVGVVHAQESCADPV